MPASGKTRDDEALSRIEGSRHFLAEAGAQARRGGLGSAADRSKGRS